MAEQYWIGGFFIDLSRNQITQNNQSQTLAPKALAVLTYLAENQGKVVSHDALLSKVWQGSVVSPNTLQRSIAQLRKALGDDGKVQTYIKTHAKQGYSLECGVRWQDNINSTNAINPQITILNKTSEDNNNNDINNKTSTESNDATSANTDNVEKPKSSSSTLSIILTIFGITILSIIGYHYFSPSSPTKLSISEIRLLTATDNKELGGNYSPDGQYIVFRRYSEVFCVNNIWAKNIKTQEEFQLTKNLDSYGSPSFSKDGKKLTFVQSKGCSQPVTQKECYTLMTLDFNQALKSQQSPRELMECKNSRIRHPIWLDNSNIALLQQTSDHWQLISYSINENKSQVLYELDDGNILDYDYSAKDDLIALTSIHKNGDYYIEILKIDGQLISSHRIKYPEEIANFRLIYPNFSPLKNQLIFSTGRQLFTLSYDGQVTNISLPLDQPMGSPIFHPNGNRMLVIKGHYDSDIALLPLSQIKQPQEKESHPPSVIERSIVGEDSAIFQPNGKLIAYKSGRSGEEQVWLTDDKSTRQLTHFPMDTYLYGMDWAADGKSILVNAHKALNQVFLDGTVKPFTLTYPVDKLFQWDSESQTALAIIRIKGALKFAEVDLQNAKVKVINNKNVKWALKSEDGQLIYTDHMDRFWQPGPAEDQLIEVLNGQGSDKRFIIKDNIIYGVNDNFKLWSYALNKGTFEIIGELPQNIDYLTDINQTDILLTLRITAKKEVAELLLRE